jgi:hypothetical protein
MLQATVGDQTVEFGEITRLGASPENDIVLTGEGVLPQHAAVITIAGREFFLSARDEDTVDGRPLVAGLRLLAGPRNRLRLGGEPLTIERLVGPRVEPYDPARHGQEECEVCGKRFEAGEDVVFCYSCQAVGHSGFCVEKADRCFRCHAVQE